MPECRTIVDGSHAGAWNMAADEVLLQRAAGDKQPQLRLYAWAPATLSLGYFQRLSERASHPASRDCPLVRRPSGGGAILHDREITYCLAIPGERIDGAALYRRVHAALADVLGKLGARAKLAANAEPQAAQAPFLCFQRRADGDVMVGCHKVIGSAQRRRRGALLQHGSLLLQASPAAPELPGLAELLPRRLDDAEWLSHLKRALAQAIECSLSESSLTAAEAERAGQLAQTKYASAAWNEMR